MMEKATIKYNNIDYQRCVLICMMVMIHIVNFSALYPGVKDFINFFFMQAFLLITGYLVNVKKTYREFGSYILKIMVPYIIMVTGYAFVSTILPVRDGISEFTLPVMLNTIFVTSIGPYWFLYTMTICGVIYYLALHLAKRFCVTARLCLFATMLIVVAQYTPILTATNAAFYFAGVCLRLSEKRLDAVIKPSLWAILPFVAIACYADFRSWGFLSVAILALSFLSFVPKVILYIRNRKALDTIGYIGRNTLPIYLFHPIFTMTGKYALPLFSFDHTGLLHVIVIITVSIAGSIAIATILDRCHLSCIFARKQFLR